MTYKCLGFPPFLVPGQPRMWNILTSKNSTSAEAHPNTDYDNLSISTELTDLQEFLSQCQCQIAYGLHIPQQVVLCRRGPCIIILQSGMMWGHTMRLYVCTKWAGPYLCHGSNCYYCVWLTTVSQKNFKPSMSQNQVKTQKFHSSSLISWDLGEGKPFQGVHHHADIV